MKMEKINYTIIATVQEKQPKDVGTFDKLEEASSAISDFQSYLTSAKILELKDIQKTESSTELKLEFSCFRAYNELLYWEARNRNLKIDY